MMDKIAAAGLTALYFCMRLLTSSDASEIEFAVFVGIDSLVAIGLMIYNKISQSSEK